MRIRGGWLGGGMTLAFTPDNAAIFAIPSGGGGVRLDVTSADHSWTAVVEPPADQTLAPGSYATTRFPSASTAGLDVFGDGRGCNGTVGSLTVHEITFQTEPEPSVQTFAATYQQQCDASSALVFGELRYHSTFDFRAATNDPFTVSFGDQLVGAATAPAQVSVTNAGTLDLSLGSVGLAGAAAADFAVSSDACSNQVVSPGATCTLGVTFTPGQEGERSAVLHLADDTIRGGRDLPLSGNGYGNDAAVGLQLSSRKVRYGQEVRVTAHLGDFEVITSNDLSIYAKPYGGTFRLVTSGTVDGDGNLSVTFEPKKKTTFVARFLGDDVFSPTSSATRTVGVSVVVTGSLLGSYRTSGGYHLYHYTQRCPNEGKGCPTFATKVTPNHEGKPVCFTLQLRVGGTWRTALSCFRLRLNGMSRATAFFVYASREIIGYPARVRTTFNGDAGHLAGSSPWSYFKVTT